LNFFTATQNVQMDNRFCCSIASLFFFLLLMSKHGCLLLPGNKIFKKQSVYLKFKIKSLITPKQ
jgi:hypothetical protein